MKSFEDYKMQQFCKGAWIQRDNEIKAAEAAKKASPLEKLAAQAREKQKAEAEAQRMPEQPPVSAGLLKLTCDVNHMIRE